MDNDDFTPAYLYRFGSAEFNEARFELKVAGKVKSVQRKPLEILLTLLRASGEVVTHEELHEQIWTGTVTVENVLANAISKLRGSLGPDNAKRIVNQPRVGYRFDGGFERIVVGRAQFAPLQMKANQRLPGRESWILESLLARTAFSEVWVARNAVRPERHVFKFNATGQHLSLLKREVTVSRLLEASLGVRADLTQVLSWNFEQPPFFIESPFFGDALDAWASRDRQLQRMPLAGRIQIFLQIARALEAAHGVGVLHKDLKPANILVRESDGQVQVRLHDFGSARVLDLDHLRALGISQHGMTVDFDGERPVDFATPLYLAPELLAGGSPSIRSDVYSLGLILFQLVVGDFHERLGPGWERAVADPFLREDIARATDTAVDHRFASVATLIDQIEGLEVRRQAARERAEAQAAEQALAEQLARSRARRPWVFGLAASLILGFAAVCLLYLKADLERANAQQEAARAEAINRFLNDDLLAAADPGRPGGIANPRMEDVLAAASSRLDHRFADAPATAATVRTTLGETYIELGDYPHAEEALWKARRESDGDVSLATLRAQVDYDLSLVLLRQGKIKQAKEQLDEGDGSAGRALRGRSRLAIQALQARGNYAYELGDFDGAIHSLETAEFLRRLIAPDDDKLRFRVGLRLLDSYVMKRRYAEAEPLARALTDPRLDIARVGVGNWANARVAQGGLLAAMRRFDDAARVDAEAVRALRERMGARHFYTAYAMGELSNVYAMQGQYREARRLMEQVLNVMRDQEGRDSQNALISAGNLGILQYQEGDVTAAVRTLDPVHGRLSRQFSPDNPQTQSTAFYLAASYAELGAQSQAAGLLQGLKVDALTGSSENDEHWAPRLQVLQALIACRNGSQMSLAGEVSAALQTMSAVTPADRTAQQLLACRATHKASRS